MKSNKRYVCLHGHFYQPPRENPWLEEVEVQESASPFHDWNERITQECYAANATSRILDDEGRIQRIVNNYSRISFNFGPTLLTWMDRHAPALVEALVEADELSRSRFSGHGSAMAQAHSHIILPLASSRDKKTQILWGLSHFRNRFGREAEGMWLPETAVDLESLEILADQGLRFVVLAPRQAKAVRPLSGGEWQNVGEGTLDTQRPYLCKLPGGGSIAAFFYHGALAQELAFGELLKDGKAFAKRLCSEFREDAPPGALVHVATDGETYGHHHRFGDMALAYALNTLEQEGMATLTVYGEYLEKHPPSMEVSLHENSSWSCVHGVERWRSDCGCHIGGAPHWNQKWRKPLRGAMDWLRERLADIYEREGREVLSDPWEARDLYEPVTADRDQAEAFLESHGAPGLDHAEKVKALKLLEMQRHGLLMYASCGWFFDDISGLEATQTMRCACRAMQLAWEVSGARLEPGYVRILETAPSNLQGYESGAHVYQAVVKPMEANLLKIGACHAVESLFDEGRTSKEDYGCFVVDTEQVRRLESGRLVLCDGKATIRSRVTWDQQGLYFCALNLGDHNVLAGVGGYPGAGESDAARYGEGREQDLQAAIEEVRAAFEDSDVLEAVRRIQAGFGKNTYDTNDLFEEARRRVQLRLLEGAQESLESCLRPIFREYSHTLKAVRRGQSPLPKVLRAALELLLNSDLEAALTGEALDPLELSLLHDEAQRWSMIWDGDNTQQAATHAADRLALQMKAQPDDTAALGRLRSFLEIADEMELEPELWECQNEVYRASQQYLDEKRRQAQSGDADAQTWVQEMETLASRLKLSLSSP